jgi:DNA repair protein RecO (recombination protein O)
MEWRDEGVILGVRNHGETSAIVEALTAEHGRCLGLVRGGRSRRMRPVLQAGNTVQIHWYARIEDHLGQFQIEPVNLQAGFIMDDRFKLAGLSTLTALAQVLPEREPHPRLYEACRIVLEAFEDDDVWPILLVRWEMGLLDELGFGLDLSKCAATGDVGDLYYVSPRTGRAVSRDAGEAYHSKLFELPAFLRGQGHQIPADVLSGLLLTGHFLERHIFSPRAIAMPQSRQWLADELAHRSAAQKGNA